MMNVIPLNLARTARLERHAGMENVPEAAADVPAAEQQRSADRRGPLRPGQLVSARARISGYATARLFRITDVASIFACAMIARPWDAANAAPALILLLSVTLILLAGLNIAKAYDFSRHEGLAFHLTRLAAAVSGAGAVTLAGLFFTRSHPALWEAVGVWLCLSLVGLYALHTAWFLVVRRWRAQGRLTPNIVVLGATEGVGRLIASALESRDVAVLGIFDDRAARAPAQIQGVPVLGDTQALLTHRVLPYVDRIVIGVPASAQTRVRQLIERLELLPNEIALLLDGDSAEADAAYGRIADLPLAHVAGVQADEARAFAKRVVDVVVGLAALVAAAPIMAVVALAVRLESPGPLLFRQRRHGFNNEEIVVWKFRSMRHEAADAKAARQVTADDDRVTRVGRFIRRTSLDELPQLLNVLKGEMSLVGPRPHAVGMRTGDVESHRLVAEYAHRHRMKPGMTGWAAIQGSRGPVDTPELVRRRVALDVEYIERQSVWLDLYILIMTVPCLLGDRTTVR